jgi:serine/threonine protein kinase
VREDFVAHCRPRTLRSDLASRGRLSVAETVVLGVQLCGALGHLHRHGLVHRDVKPSNAIFAQGQPKLADLGLVATAQEAHSFVGTEGFIPPEGPGTAKADLFALGRLLYEAATGKDRCAFPELPSDLDTWPDRDAFLELNEVLSRLCAPAPHRRCANAAEAAGDLNLLLAGRSIRRAYGIDRRLKRATRIATLALGILALAASTNLMCYNATWSDDGRFLAVKRDHDRIEHGCDLEVWDLATVPRRTPKCAGIPSPPAPLPDRRWREPPCDLGPRTWSRTSPLRPVAWGANPSGLLAER